MFFDKEIVYTDVLEEWRKIKIWDFNLFDKVVVWRDVCILIWDHIASVSKNSYIWWYSWFTFIDKWESSKYRWWKIIHLWEWYEKMEFLLYNCINIKWDILTAYEIKKYYWEFQEEFESLDKAIREENELKKKIIELKELEESMNNNYKKARSIQWKNYKELWII